MEMKYLMMYIDDGHQLANACDKLGIAYKTNAYQSGDNAFVARLTDKDWARLDEAYPYADWIPCSAEDLESGGMVLEKVEWV